MAIGAAAFWMFLAAIVISGKWRSMRREAVRHETLRFLVEKNQKIDEAQLAELLNPKLPAAPEWLVPRQKPGDGYRALRVFGTILMFVAFGLGIAGFWRGMILGKYDKSVLGIATAIPLVAMVGAGLFFASRFVTPPTSAGNNDKQDRM
jgi:hypothetical protein